MAYSHVFVNKSQVNGLNTNPVVHNHTPGSMATVAILSIIGAGNTARTGGAPVIDGVTATQADQTRGAASSYEETIELWYVVKIFSGSQFQVSIPNNNTRTLHIEVITASAGIGFQSLYQSSGGNNSTSTSSISASFTQSAQGDFKYVRAGSGEGSSGDLSLSWTNHVLTFQNDHGSYVSHGAYLICGASNVNPTWSLSSDDIVTSGVCFRAIPINVVSCVISS